jgi:putative Holliday junction resolvase
MRILGIDYGKSKVGLAISESSLAEPLRVIRYSDKNALVEQIKQVATSEGVEKIIVGESEGAMGQESREFAKLVGGETFDETLTSQDAQKLSREAGISRKKRRGMEDAYAATIMLQNYLDSKVG